MKNNIKRLLCGVLAAVVLVASAPAATPVAAATKAAATSSTPKQEVTVKKPAKVNCTAKKKAIRVSIKKVSGATGYQIQYSTKKNFKSSRKTITTKKTVYTINKLGAKKVYYVRVRAYKTVKGKKVYSKWTATKRIRTKK